MPTWMVVKREHISQRYAKGLSNTDRIKLLIRWWGETNDTRFSDAAFELSQSPVSGLDSWRDGEEAIELIAKLRDGDYFEELPRADEMADHLEAAAVAMLETNLTSEELEKISDAVDDWRRHLTDQLFHAVDDAIRYEIENVGTVVEEMDSESTLLEHIDTINKLGERVGLSSQAVSRAIERVKDRITKLEEETEVSDSPSFPGSKAKANDVFDDTALKNLFTPLIQSNDAA
ncbi:hypothetical protein I6F35_18410 [Bradyrhizobium sp. BRP22]|uniref:hypothetical protein n=1 Tax=Bradyrhizobium sp. BRP22 TaxID=2793821 RepID=UPI001CD75879|nr:hypothetical protein [Bradyrhizobium sp. BRP22]MCA1455179.1 hypothetical protein [Bradyrhizobium sp. BRP22]